MKIPCCCSTIPDNTNYTYNNSGYQYDPTTGLYYDPTSNYYWNSAIQRYLYWDQEKLTYVLAPTTDEYYAAAQTTPTTTQEPETKQRKSEEQDKVNAAKKIATDMERWAKNLNRKKESSNSRANPDPAATTSGSATAEVFEDIDYLDFKRLICKLCKRQFTSAETLTRHSKLSSLHKQNLEAKGGTKKGGSEKSVYRDRAKERRMKYGNPVKPQPSKWKKYSNSRKLVENLPVATTSVMKPIGTENVGNKLLQKIGWTEGQGLGKSNQGRTTIIQVKQRSSTVGLGKKVAAHSALAGEPYKECVKKMM